MKKLVLLQHFLFAVVITFVTACVLQTQMVLLELTKLNIIITWSDRLHMVWQDLLGLLPSYGAIVAIGLGIGFGIAKLVKTYSSINSYRLYILAGGLTMAVILFAMQPVLGVTLLAGARSGLGIGLQIFAGLLGGFIFMYFRKAQ
jgi:hypothetical protein